MRVERFLRDPHPFRFLMGSGTNGRKRIRCNLPSLLPDRFLDGRDHRRQHPDHIADPLAGCFDLRVERRLQGFARGSLFVAAEIRTTSAQRLETAYNSSRRRRSAFIITENELKVIAALAIMGLRSRPNHG